MVTCKLAANSHSISSGILKHIVHLAGIILIIVGIEKEKWNICGRKYLEDLGSQVNNLSKGGPLNNLLNAIGLGYLVTLSEEIGIDD